MEGITPAAPAAQPAAPAADPAASAADAQLDQVLGPSDAELIAQYRAKEASAAPAPAAPPPSPATQPISDPAAPAAAPDPDAALNARIAEYVRKQNEDVSARLGLQRQLEADRAELARLKAEHEGLRTRLREDPLEALKPEGWDFEALARRAVGQGTPEAVEIRRMREEVAKVKAELADRTKREEEARTAAESQRQIQAWEASVMPALEAKRDQFKHLLTIMDPHEIVAAVRGTVQQTYQGSGGARVLGIEEAAALLEQNAAKRVERIRTLVTESTGAAKSSPAANQPKPPAPRGLTNQVTQAGPSPSEPEDLSDEALTAKAKRWYEDQLRARQ